MSMNDGRTRPRSAELDAVGAELLNLRAENERLLFLLDEAHGVVTGCREWRCGCKSEALFYLAQTAAQP